MVEQSSVNFTREVAMLAAMISLLGPLVERELLPSTGSDDRPALVVAGLKQSDLFEQAMPAPSPI